MIKRCPHCGLEKSTDEFYKHSRNKDGFRSWCKSCGSEYNKRYKYKYDPSKEQRAKDIKRNRNWRSKNKELIYNYNESYRKENRDKYISGTLLYTYGITLEQKQEMLRKQNGKCAICDKELDIGNAEVDHDHKTDKVRGILCGGCNKMLGFGKDDIHILRQGIEYLIYHNKK